MAKYYRKKARRGVRRLRRRISKRRRNVKCRRTSFNRCMKSAMARVARKVAKAELERDKPAFEVLTSVEGVTAAFNHFDVFEDTRHNIFWAPFKDCWKIDLSEGLDNLKLNPELVRITK